MALSSSRWCSRRGTQDHGQSSTVVVCGTWLHSLEFGLFANWTSIDGSLFRRPKTPRHSAPRWWRVQASCSRMAAKILLRHNPWRTQRCKTYLLQSHLWCGFWQVGYRPWNLQASSQWAQSFLYEGIQWCCRLDQIVYTTSSSARLRGNGAWSTALPAWPRLHIRSPAQPCGAPGREHCVSSFCSRSYESCHDRHTQSLLDFKSLISDIWYELSILNIICIYLYVLICFMLFAFFCTCSTNAVHRPQKHILKQECTALDWLIVELFNVLLGSIAQAGLKELRSHASDGRCRLVGRLLLQIHDELMLEVEAGQESSSSQLRAFTFYHKLRYLLLKHLKRKSTFCTWDSTTYQVAWGCLRVFDQVIMIILINNQ